MKHQKIGGLKLQIPSRKEIPANILQKIINNQYISNDDSEEATVANQVNRVASPSFQEKYEIIEKLGEGTNGIVFKCLRKDSQTVYAVKQMTCELEHINSLKSSYNFIKMFDHPSIIKYKSMYIWQGRETFLVMEYFNHPNLAQIQLTKQQIKDVSYKLLDAIQYMHKQGVCHRDIKPENILYDRENKLIKIIDFGVSREMKTGRFKKSMMTGTGTLNYKAPQLFRTSSYDELIDQWAAGVTIYHLICGHTPFESNYITETIANIEKCVVSFQESVWEGYSNIAKELIKSLVSPREKRIIAGEAKNSLWFSGHKQFSQSFHRVMNPSKNDFLVEKSANFKLNPKEPKLKNKVVIMRDLKNTDLIFNSERQCQSSEYEVSDEDEDIQDLNRMYQRRNQAS